ncbi:hypothetical protein J1614_005510 [Plenodomus biglobosus]|nr:hypothetical protein J1614_005510 [Plenodomus biglobosus]
MASFKNMSTFSIFWPTKSYHSDAKISLSWDPTDRFVIVRNNTGNDTQDYTPWMFDYRATPLPNLPNQRAMKMSILERRFNDDLDLYNLASHAGPTIILVKTAEWPSRTSSYNRPTATNRSSNDDDDDNDDDRKMKGIIAGTVVGIVAAIMLALFCCCRRCCCAQRGKRVKEDKEVQAGIIGQGKDVMAQRGVLGTIVHLHRTEDVASPVEGGPGNDHEIRRGDVVHRSQQGDDVDCHGDPPPKYMP